MKNNSDEKEKVLLHVCCAICAGHPVELLQEQGYQPIAYFFNPNIYPESEYDKRLNAVEALCSHYGCKLITEKYEHADYQNKMKEYEGYPEGSERCIRCIEYRLLKTAMKACELKISKFTTTLSSSPHKNYEIIRDIGLQYSKMFEIEYLDYNFKKQDGFLKTTRIANSLGLYRQNYCGCENSLAGVKNS